MTNAQYIARELALSILKAYHREIKSGFVSDASAVERERGQAKAFEAAENGIRDLVVNHGGIDELCVEDPSWIDSESEKQ